MTPGMVVLLPQHSASGMREATGRFRGLLTYLFMRGHTWLVLGVHSTYIYPLPGSPESPSRGRHGLVVIQAVVSDRWTRPS